MVAREGLRAHLSTLTCITHLQRKSDLSGWLSMLHHFLSGVDRLCSRFDSPWQKPSDLSYGCVFYLLFTFYRKHNSPYLWQTYSVSSTWANSNFLNVQHFPSRDCWALSHLGTRTQAWTKGYIANVCLCWLICSCLAAAWATMLAHFWLTSSLNQPARVGAHIIWLDFYFWLFVPSWYFEKLTVVGLLKWFIFYFSFNNHRQEKTRKNFVHHFLQQCLKHQISCLGNLSTTFNTVCFYLFYAYIADNNVALESKWGVWGIYFFCSGNIFSVLLDFFWHFALLHFYALKERTPCLITIPNILLT